MIQISENTRVIDLTIGELMGYIKKSLPEIAAKDGDSGNEHRLEFGLQGIATIFNCSISTANRIKASGRIDAAISQVGRKMVIDAEKALELMKRK